MDSNDLKVTIEENFLKSFAIPESLINKLKQPNTMTATQMAMQPVSDHERLMQKYRHFLNYVV